MRKITITSTPGIILSDVSVSVGGNSVGSTTGNDKETFVLALSRPVRTDKLQITITSSIMMGVPYMATVAEAVVS